MTDATRKALVKIYGALFRAGWDDPTEGGEAREAKADPKEIQPRNVESDVSKVALAFDNSLSEVTPWLGWLAAYTQPYPDWLELPNVIDTKQIDNIRIVDYQEKVRLLEAKRADVGGDNQG